MRAFFRSFRALHLWLLVLAVFFGVYLLLRQSRTAMNTLCTRVVLPFAQGLGRLWNRVPFSVAEALIALAGSAVIVWLLLGLHRLIAGPHRGRAAYGMALTALCAAATVYAGFCLLWGTFYNTDSFQQRSGIVARGGTVEELQRVTALFAKGVADASADVARDSQMCFTGDRAAILTAAGRAYQGLEKRFPFLTARGLTAVKPVANSRIMSMLQFTGFYFPFTGEVNVNMDSPAAFLGATACHELSHQRGVASEQECNFLGILAAVESEDNHVRYSGWLLGYLYLSNALYRTDREAWQTVRDTLPDGVIADLHQNNVFWAAFRGPVQQISDTVYDGFLKANGDPMGIQSYGTVVDMLIAYYA